MEGKGQQHIVPEWTIVESSSQSNGNGEAWGIDSDSNDDLFWSTSLTGSGWNAGLDVYTIKLNPDSSRIWNQASHFYAENDQQAYVTVATDSVVYIGGRYCNGWGIETCDMMLFGIDNATGDTLWLNTWDQDSLYEEVDGLVPQQNGIFVTGWTETDSSDLDLLLMKTDHQGNVQWWNSWGSDRVDHQDGHVVSEDSVIYLCGLYKGDPSSNPVARGLNGKSLLATFSANDGTLIDSTTFGRKDPWDNFENALGMTSDGAHLYVTGTTTPAPNDHQIFLAKYDMDLNQVWQRTWGGDSTETARTVIEHNGILHVVGSTNSPQYNSGGKYDAAILSWTLNGDFLGYRTFGGQDDQDAREAHVMGDAIYVAGATGKLSLPADKDAYLSKIWLDSLASSIRQEQMEEEPFSMRLFPDPVATTLHVELLGDLGGSYRIRLRDMMGSVVHSKKIHALPHQKKLRVDVDVSDLRNGVYFITFEDPEGGRSTKKFLRSIDR